MKKQVISWIGLSLALLTGLTACSPFNTGTAEAPTEILTQKETPEGKIPVTVLVKYAFTINTFEKAVEEQFPNLNLIQVGNFTANSGLAEYEARMEHDDLTDIVMTWPLEVGKQYWGDRLLDLSAMPFTGKYNTANLNEIASDGKLYYLPGPAQIRGIVYNKTLFAEKGWEVPKDFEGFIMLCQEIEADGIRSLQLGLGNAEVLDTAFAGYGFASSFSTPKDTQWIADYNSGKGSFGDHFGPALDTFQTLIESGVLKPEDLEVTYSKREQMLFNRECAMVEDSVLLTHMGSESTGTKDEFALMPFFNPGSDSDWARLYRVCYVGLNKHLSEPANQEKYDLVMQIMEYISTPEGQTALAGDTGGMYSSLNNMQQPDVPEIAALLPALEHGRCAVFPELTNAQDALRKGLAGMVSGQMTADDVIKMVDAENLSPPVSPLPSVVGTADQDFTIMDTANFLTDAMRTKSGCEIALLMDNGKDGLYNGKGICSKIYKGDITTVDIQRLMPDTKRKEKSELEKVTMTGENLIRTLEYSIPVDNKQSNWFYYFSGLKMEYAPSAEPGKRILKITDSKGNAIDPQKIYTIAIMDSIVPEQYCQSVENMGILISDLLTEAITDQKTISPSRDGRFTIR